MLAASAESDLERVLGERDRVLALQRIDLPTHQHHTPHTTCVIICRHSPRHRPRAAAQTSVPALVHALPAVLTMRGKWQRRRRQATQAPDGGGAGTFIQVPSTVSSCSNIFLTASAPCTRQLHHTRLIGRAVPFRWHRCEARSGLLCALRQVGAQQ